MSEQEPTVYVIDDDELVRGSLERLVRSIGLRVQSFASARDFIAARRNDGPGCLVLDVRLPDLSGLELQQHLRAVHIHTPIVFITAHGDIPMTVRAMKAGALEFLPKPVRGQDLLDAVQRGISRDRELRREHAELDELRARFAGLTPREAEVLELIVAGLLNKQIGERLGMSELTVKTHRAHLMEKTRADSLAHLVRMFERLSAATPAESRSPSKAPEPRSINRPARSPG